MDIDRKGRDLKLRVFDTLEEENRAESCRLAEMTPEERFEEFAILQQRAFGKQWTTDPIKKTVRFEILDW